MSAVIYEGSGPALGKEPAAKRICVSADSKGVAQIHDFIDSVLGDIAPSDGTMSKLSSRVHVVSDEICANIVSYSGADSFSYSIGLCERGIVIKTSDNGIPYNPLERDIPEIPEPSENGGLGIFIVRQMTDSLEYDRTCGKNNLTAVLKRF